MPINPHALEERDPRFADQRWLLDLIISLAGPDWDQGRIEYRALPVSPDNKGAFQSLKSSIRKLDDLPREMTKVARHFELRAKAEEEVGHEVSAGADFLAASVLYGGAQWPIYSTSKLNVVLEKKKTDCYLAYARYADHHIEAVEVPYEDASVAAWFHLPIGYSGGQVPCVVMTSGMDAFKEVGLLGAGDRYLSRGMAVLVVDVPGQGTSLVREIVYEPEKFGQVGVNAFDLVAARPEVDESRITVTGLSQGSFWATQMAAAEPRYAACAVMLTCFDPHNTSMFAAQSPTFRQKFMYMTGTSTVEELEAAVATMDVRPLSAKLTMPYLVIMGEDDPLTDPEQTFSHLNAVPGPKELLFYVGEDHGPVTRSAGQLGPPVFRYIPDWMADRAAGRPLESRIITVDALGRLHPEPWGDEQHYEYGAPLDADTLLGDSPDTGLQ